MRLRARRPAACIFQLLLAVCLGCLPAVASAASSGVSAPAPAYPPRILLVECHDTLQPKRADLFVASLDRARDEHFAAVVIDFSSPGGMVVSADRIVAAMRRSPVPIIVWMGTANSRVSGEALRILAEADVVVMSDTDYLTPLWTEVPRRLIPSQRIAGSRRLTLTLADSIARHGRSPSAIDELATGIHWFTAAEALQAGFIDGIAIKQADVLRFVTAHGYRKNGVQRQLDLSHAIVIQETIAPQSDLLVALMNPNLCVLLFTLGLLLIYLEINTPGVVVPGTCGVLLLLLSAYSLSRLPLNLAAAGFCLLAIVLLLLEAQTRYRGILAIAGIATLGYGLDHLVQGPLPQLEVSPGTAIGAGIGFGGLTALLLILGMEARRAKVRTGADAMLGWLAVAETALTPNGQILVRGELWKARLTSSEGAVAAGDPVKVLRADGLVLEVTAVPISPQA